MGKCRSLWRCFPLTKLTKAFRRSPLFKKTLIIAGICVVYLIFVTSHFGSSSHNKTTARDDGQRGHSRGLYHAGNSEVLPVAVVAPTRPNVVYITLKAKRLKPANIRGTIRPKLRRKAKTHKFGTFTHDLVDSLERDANQTNALHASWSDIMKVDYKHVDIPGIYDTKTDYISSSIRIYSQKPPPWFTSTDVHAMRFLADAKVVRVRKVTHGARDGGSACVGRCGIIRSPVDAIEVFAFHLDRVLGLNRTLPAVSRKFTFLHDNAPCPVVQWAPSPPSSVHITWAQYQRSLKHKCWLKNISPKSDSDCCSIHHHEWSRLALFDFLLQVTQLRQIRCCSSRYNSIRSSLSNFPVLVHIYQLKNVPKAFLKTPVSSTFLNKKSLAPFLLLSCFSVVVYICYNLIQNTPLKHKKSFLKREYPAKYIYF
uniref:Golgi associated kinase 1B n=1 Tax=Periophthalmus magnuspinnatus TaxID=409849 RepID=A0A3B4BE39_9GOBI